MDYKTILRSIIHTPPQDVGAIHQLMHFASPVVGQVVTSAAIKGTELDLWVKHTISK